MGKNTKSPSAAATGAAATDPAAAANAAKQAAERAAANDVFKYRGEVVAGSKKLAPQAQNIVNLIQAAGENGITRENLLKQQVGVVVTRQPQSRILGYYQKEIQEKGYVTLTKAAVPVAPPAAAEGQPAAAAA